MDRLRFPKQINTLMKGMYGNLERRFKLNGYLGEPILSDAKRGALQGRAFSMVAMNIAALAWFAAVQNGFSSAVLEPAVPVVKQLLCCSDDDWPGLRDKLLSRGSDSVRMMRKF